MLFLPTVLSWNNQSRLVGTVGCPGVTAVWSLCTPPPASQLALLSNNSKVDSTGQKIDNLRNRWAYIAVFLLILKWKSHAIA